MWFIYCRLQRLIAVTSPAKVVDSFNSATWTRMASSSTTIDLYKAIVDKPERKTAIYDQYGRITYGQLKTGADVISRGIHKELGTYKRG